MIKIEKVSYKALKSLSISDRLKTASDPGVGTTLMSALTPSQIADLFPSYYRQRLPDIQGFLQAVPSSITAQKQAYYEQQVQDAAAGGKAGISMKPFAPAASAWDKVKRRINESTGAVSGKGKPLPKPQLTAAQFAAIEDLKKGAIPVDDPRVKFMAGLSNEQLKVTGIQRTAGPGGKEVFQYTAPQVGEEEAKKSLSSKSSADQMALNLIRKREGFLSSPKWDVNHYRAGYGSDTVTLSDGTVREVVPGMHITKEDAERDLIRRMPEFQRKGIIRYVGEDSWNRLNPQAQAAITSLAYNYGSIENLGSLREAIKSGDHNAIANAVESYRGHNNGVNAGRRMEEASMIRNSTPGASVITKDFTPAQIAAEKYRLEQEKSVQGIEALAGFTSPQLGERPDIRHATDSGTTDINSLMARAEAIGKQSSPGFTMGGPNGRGQAACGIGARAMAGAMFGNSYFSQTLGTGGSAAAASLSGGNSYFQRSGLYNNPMSAGDLSDPSYRASLPVGTVISAAGGKSGNGHVQIKYGPGPNDWASDFNQKEHGGVLLHGYSNYMVHIPNQQGQQALAERGYSVTSAPAEVTREATDPNPPGVAPSLNAYGQPIGTEPDIKQLDQPAGMPSGPPPSTQTQSAPDSVASKVSSEPQAAPKIDAKATVSSGNYNVNVKNFREAIKNDPSNTYPGWMIDMASDDDIRNGFNNDARVKAAGVHIDENWKMQVKDINHPDVKDVLSGAQKQGALKAIEEKKKAEIKPGESKAPTADISAKQSNTKAIADEKKSGGADSPQYDIDRTMAIIRRQESGSFGGDYSADAAKKTKGKMTASGAYQFNNKTWGAVTKQFNLGTEYKRAVDAPREVQDAVMRARVEDLYKKHGSLEKVLMTHFTGNPAGKMSAKAIAANKGLTGPQYVSSIIGQHGPEYDKMKAGVSPSASTAAITPTPTAPIVPISMPGVAAKDRISPNVSPGVDRSHEVRNEIQNLRNHMQIANVTEQRDIQPRQSTPPIGDDNTGTLNNMMMQTQVAYTNPTAERALGARPNFSETGDSRQHFNIGNTA